MNRTLCLPLYARHWFKKPRPQLHAENGCGVRGHTHRLLTFICRRDGEEPTEELGEHRAAVMRGDRHNEIAVCVQP